MQTGQLVSFPHTLTYIHLYPYQCFFSLEYIDIEDLLHKVPTGNYFKKEVAGHKWYLTSKSVALSSN